MFKFTINNLCQQTISIASPTVTQGVNIPGVKKDSWSNVASGILATVQPMRGDAIEEFGKIDIDVDYIILSDNAAMSAANLVNGYRASDGTANYVIKHWENPGGQNLVYTIYCKKIEGN